MKNTDSQNKKILSHLLKGGRISSMDAIKWYSCTRLASRINELKDKYPISDYWVQVDKARFKVYYIRPQDLKEQIKRNEKLLLEQI